MGVGITRMLAIHFTTSSSILRDEILGFPARACLAISLEYEITGKRPVLDKNHPKSYHGPVVTACES